jgi:tetratricopeptide (TPR) repeat protein
VFSELTRPFALWLSLAAACVPTISQPRGEQHLAKLAEAEADQHAGRYEEAVAAYKAAAASAERRVDRDEALYRASRVLARMDRLPEAIALCDELAAADPPARRTLRARLDAARYRLSTGEEARAEQDLLRLVLEDPDSGAGKSALRLLIARHVEAATSHDEALAWLDGLLGQVKDAPSQETLLNVKAEVLLALGRRADAIQTLEQQIARFPYPKGHRWDDALYRLADLALDDGDPTRAIGYLEKMIEVHESSFIVGSYTRPLFSKAALRIARIYRDQLHDPAAALKAYGRVRSEFPKSLVADDALQEEAELLFAQGKKDEACALLREVLEQHEVGAARHRAEAQLAKDCSSSP